MGSIWNRLKETMKELEEIGQKYTEVKLQEEKMKKEMAEDILKVFQESEEKIRDETSKWTQPLMTEQKEELIQLFKMYLRTDEHHAETVAIFFECLHEKDRETFLKEFSEEEKVVLLFQHQNLKSYREEIFVETVKEIHQEVR